MSRARIPEPLAQTEKIGRNIRIARIACGMNRLTLAHALGFEGDEAYVDVYEMELGHWTVDVRMLRRLSELLRTSLEFLILGLEEDGDELEHDRNDGTFDLAHDVLDKHARTGRSATDQAAERWYLERRVRREPSLSEPELELALLGYRAQRSLLEPDLQAFEAAVRRRRLREADR